MATWKLQAPATVVAGMGVLGDAWVVTGAAVEGAMPVVEADVVAACMAHTGHAKPHLTLL